MEKKTHIAVVPSAGFSHLVPIIEFSKRLVQLHPEIHVTCIIPTLGSPPNASKAYLETLPSNIDSIFLPPVAKEDIPQGVHTGVQIQLAVTLSLPYIREELKSVSSRNGLVALVADVFAHEALNFAAELNILSYLYLPLSAMLLSLYFYSSKLHETFSSEFRDLQEPIEIPGCIPFHGRDIPDSLCDRSGLIYKQFLERSKRCRLADGVLFNSFLELETEAIKALQDEIKGKPQIYPVGPIIQSGSSSEANGSNCLRWLDNQPPRSVLYVSFGSGGTLSQDQLNELAFGLELSGKKFLWVVRAPSNIPSAAYLSATNDDPLHFLPKGFMERTREQSLVVPSWAPQIEILSHNSTGGFLCHCGWNSTLESIVHGVPIMAWPLFAEQKMNAVSLTDGLKVALRPKVNQSGTVEREEIAKVIRRLMEGVESKQIRKRMEDLKYAAANALKEDGSSKKALSLFAVNLTAQQPKQISSFERV